MSTLNCSIQSIPLKDITILSDRDRIFCQQEKRITKHQSFEPNIEGFRKSIENRYNNQPNRELLVSVLNKQYKSILNNEDESSIDQTIVQLLDDNTFTVTTAHQPVLFGGPLYTMYKIAGTINLSLRLQKEFPNNKFIPIFVLGAEDHDFDEMKSVHLYNKSITWQNNETGSVGRMTNKGVLKAIEELKLLLSETENDKELIRILETCFTSSITYAESYQKFIHQLFHSYNLVVLNMDDEELKKSFIPIIQEEIISQSSIQHVLDVQKTIVSDGMKPQVYPRNINVFYNTTNKRKRLVQEGDYYKVVDSSIQFTQSEILFELQNNPKRFSPNVILRPVYQEYILPNLAYIGGGGEIAYWIEETNVFKQYNVPFPILLRRNSALWINKKDGIQMTNSRWQTEQLFEPLQSIIKQYLSHHNDTVDHSEYDDKIDQIFQQLGVFATNEKLDLARYLTGQNIKTKQLIAQAIKKINQGTKQKHEVQLKRLEKTYYNLFPENKLQERKNSFIPIYSQWGSKFLDILIGNLDPLDFSFVVFKED